MECIKIKNMERKKIKIGQPYDGDSGSRPQKKWTETTKPADITPVYYSMFCLVTTYTCKGSFPITRQHIA